MPMGPCDHGPMRRALTLVLVIGLGAAGCSTGRQRDLASYYDPEGLFVARLPEANAVTVAPPQPAPSGPSLLTGVISRPPAPSPSPQAQFGGGLAQGLGQTQPSDQTVYEAFVVTTDDFADLSEMTVTFLTGDPTFDVREERPIRIAGTVGRLVVADAIQDGEVRSSVAAAFSLGRDGVGYLVAALFPAGAWEAEEADFLRVVDSFRAEVPPGLRTFPVGGGDA
jgi:hypothetical protein